MNKTEAWDDLKQWLSKATTEMYRLSTEKINGHIIIPSEELKRRKHKANGMDLVLGKMKEYEKSFIDS